MKSSGEKNRRAGVTLVELLVVVVLMAILTVAVGSAFVAGLDMERLQKQRRAQQERSDRLEQTVTRLLQGALITDDVDDATTFFVASSVEGDSQLGSDRLTFTTTGPGLSLAARENTDDFETQQAAQGPIGGVAEVSIGTTAFGDAGERTGLFQRVQRPADGDPTQGGREWLLDPQIGLVGFQFFNGTDWVDEWDTILGGDRRLPAAVRVSYVLKETPEDAVRSFVVTLPASDVNSLNPTNIGGQP
jgi:prepilin-type N-terminal cleavage/methylation domain-containing protein